MKFHIILFLVFLTFYSTSIYAQYRVSGYVEDETTKEKLFSATVIVKNSTYGTLTNFYGFFSIELQKPTDTLEFSYVGFETKHVIFNLKNDTTILVSLNPSLELEEVVISGVQDETIEKQVQVSAITIPGKQLLDIPAIGGEVDVLKAIQLLPGVQSGTEGFNGVYVRGGGPDQNLILIDGVPLYNVSHLGGLFSVFNPHTVSDLSLIKGGFPAKYGGRLSSIINVKLKDGDKVNRNAKMNVSLISASLYTDGPFAKGKGSYMFGFRRTYLDWVFRSLSDIGKNGYFFYDFNGKINYSFSQKDHVFSNVYLGNDVVYIQQNENNQEIDQDIRWGNLEVNVGWNHIFKDNLFTTFNVNYTRYRLKNELIYEDFRDNNKFTFNYFSGIQDISGKYEIEYYFNTNHEFLAGAHFIRHQFSPGFSNIYYTSNSQTIDQSYGNLDLYSNELSSYIEDSWTISRAIKLNAGLHFNNYFINTKVYSSIQPRVTLRILTSPNSSLKLSYAEMQQNVHLLTSANVGLPTDLWMPSIEKVPPQYSKQATISFSKTLFYNFEASVELYYKNMTNLINYKEGHNWLNTSFESDWSNIIETGGKGISKGLELFIHKKEGNLGGWIGYTLSKTDLQFDNLNNGQEFPFKYDRRHDISFLTTYKINKNIILSLIWVYNTGNSISIGQAEYLSVKNFNIDNSPNIENTYYDFHESGNVIYYGGKNNFKTGDYHRADLGVKFIKEKKRGTRTWNITIYNVYNRKNPFYVYWDGGKELKQVSLFPIIPMVSYEFDFALNKLNKK